MTAFANESTATARPTGWRRVAGRSWRLFTFGSQRSHAALQRADAALSDGDLAQALAECDDAVRLDFDSVGAYFKRSEVRAALGDAAGAKRDLALVDQLRPNYAPRQVQKGDADAAYGRLVAAIHHYDLAIADGSAYVAAFVHRGIVCQQLGYPADAVQSFTLALQVGGWTSDVLIRRSESQFVLGLFELAIRDCNDAILLEPDCFRAFLLRAQLFDAKGDAKRAEADFSRAISLDPRSSIAYQLRGRHRHRVQNLAGAIEDYDRAIAIGPPTAECYFNRSGLHFGSGRLQEAIADLDETLRLKQDWAPALHRRGLARHAKGDLRGALSDLNLAIFKDLGNPRAYCDRGRVRLALGLKDRAIDDFNQAVKLAPAVAGFYYERGSVWRVLGHPDSAISDFNKALELSPESNEVLNDRGVVLLEDGRLEEAIQDFGELLRRDADCIEALVNRGIAFQRLGHLNEAIADFSRAIQLDPVNVTALFNRGLVWGDQKRFDKAIEDFSEAHRLHPRDLAIVERRGLAYYNYGEFSKAIADLDVVLEHIPTPLAFHGRGMARSRLGDYAGAISDLTNAFRGEFQRVPEFLAQLAWVRATCPDPQFRDGPRAVADATAACQLSSGTLPFARAVLASALAAVGDFEGAKRELREAMGLSLPEDFPPEWRDMITAFESRNAWTVLPTEGPFSERQPESGVASA